jgi:hypothetical protein
VGRWPGRSRSLNGAGDHPLGGGCGDPVGTAIRQAGGGGLAHQGALELGQAPNAFSSNLPAALGTQMALSASTITSGSASADKILRTDSVRAPGVAAARRPPTLFAFLEQTRPAAQR